MSAEIVAKLGLKAENFARGLAESETKFKNFVRRVEAIKASKAAGDILPPLPEVERQAGGIMGTLRRKFSAGDIFKDTLRGLGVGLGVGAIANAITKVFSHGAERAKELASHTEALLDNTRRWASALGGPTRELELQVKQVNDLNRDIETQRNLIASLKANPLQILSDDATAQLKEAESALDALILKQANLSTGAQIAALETNRRTEALKRQLKHEENLHTLEKRRAVEGQKFAERRRALEEERTVLEKQGALPSSLQENTNRIKALEREQEIFNRTQDEKIEDLKLERRLSDELTKAELSSASELEKKQIRLNALLREREVLLKRVSVLSPEAKANENAQAQLRNEMAVERKRLRDDRRDSQIQLGSQLSGRNPSRAPRLRERGRSERERIADRGVGFAMQMDEAVRTAKSPEYVAKLRAMSERDLGASAKKAQESMSKLKSTDGDIGSQLQAANGHLAKIEAALNSTPVTDNGGGNKGNGGKGNAKPSPK